MNIVNFDRLEENGELLTAGMRAMLGGMLTAEELGRLAYAGHSSARQEALKLKGRLMRIDVPQRKPALPASSD